MAQSTMMFCKMCFNAGRPGYDTHFVRKYKDDPNSEVTCHFLLSLSCLNCGQFGHTASYCKFRRSSDQRQQRESRESDVRVRAPPPKIVYDNPSKFKSTAPAAAAAPIQISETSFPRLSCRHQIPTTPSPSPSPSPPASPVLLSKNPFAVLACIEKQKEEKQKEENKTAAVRNPKMNWAKVAATAPPPPPAAVAVVLGAIVTTKKEKKPHITVPVLAVPELKNRASNWCDDNDDDLFD